MRMEKTSTASPNPHLRPGQSNTCACPPSTNSIPPKPVGIDPSIRRCARYGNRSGVLGSRKERPKYRWSGGSESIVGECIFDFATTEANPCLAYQLDPSPLMQASGATLPAYRKGVRALAIGPALLQWRPLEQLIYVPSCGSGPRPARHRSALSPGTGGERSPSHYDRRPAARSQVPAEHLVV
jgi:hypothetical protein